MAAADAILFDLDQTLLDGSAFQSSIVGTCEALARLVPRLSAAELLRANTEVWQRYWVEIERDWLLGNVSGAAVKKEAWRRTLQRVAAVDENRLCRALDIHTELEWNSHRLFDDALGVVQGLRSAGLPVGLVTNGASDTQRDKLSAVHLENAFDVVVVSAEIGAAKPEPLPFELAMARLSISGPRVWHIGDSLESDVAGARAAGITAVWLNRSGRRRLHREPQPDAEIRSLLELPDLIR